MEMNLFKAALNENEGELEAGLGTIDDKAKYKLLRYSVSFQKEKSVKFLLDSGCSINFPSDPTNTPLHIAINKKNIKLIEMLLDRGASVKIPNEVGKTSLHWSEKTKDRNIVKMIADKWVQEEGDEVVVLPLLLACLRNDLVSAETLLRSGTEVNVNLADWLGYTYLHIAVEYGYDEMVKILLKHGADANLRNDDGLTPSQLALLSNKLEMLDSILSFGKSVDVNVKDSAGNTLLILAAQQQSNKLVEMLLANGAMVDIKNSNGQTALYYAVMLDNIQISKTILTVYCGKCLADDDKRRFSQSSATTEEVEALVNSTYASKTLIEISRSDEILKLLLNHQGAGRCARDSEGSTLLHLTVKDFIRNPYEIASRLKLLLSESTTCDGNIDGEQLENNERNVDVNVIDNYGNTPLHLLAQKRGHIIEIADILIESGADVTRLNSGNRTPIHSAAYARNWKLAMLMTTVDRSCYNGTNPTDPNGLSHFHIACFGNNQEIINKFLDNGVDIMSIVSADVYEKIDGYSALHFAALGKRAEVAELLIRRGADVDFSSLDLTTKKAPLLVAAQSGSFDVMKVLLEHGANFYDSDGNHNNIIFELMTGTLGRDGESEREIANGAIDLLLENNCDLNELLEDAINYCNVNFVENLLDRRADVDFSMVFGETECRVCRMPQLKCRSYEALMKYIWKSEMMMDAPVSENILQWFSKQPSDSELYSDFKQSCFWEWEALKEKNAINEVTLDLFIRKDSEVMRKYIHKKNWKRIVEEITGAKSDFERKFPIYGRSIKLNIQRAKTRQEMINSASSSLEPLIGLAETCRYEIVKYLPNEKLKNLIDMSRVNDTSV